MPLERSAELTRTMSSSPKHWPQESAVTDLSIDRNDTLHGLELNESVLDFTSDSSTNNDTLSGNISCQFTAGIIAWPCSISWPTARASSPNGRAFVTVFCTILHLRLDVRFEDNRRLPAAEAGGTIAALLFIIALSFPSSKSPPPNEQISLLRLFCFQAAELHIVSYDVCGTINIPRRDVTSLYFRVNYTLAEFSAKVSLGFRCYTLYHQLPAT